MAGATCWAARSNRTSLYLARAKVNWGDTTRRRLQCAARDGGGAEMQLSELPQNPAIDGERLRRRDGARIVKGEVDRLGDTVELKVSAVGVVALIEQIGDD